MTPTVFIHTNHKQIVGALVSQYSLTRNSRHPERFQTQIINSEDHPFLKAREGQPFLRESTLDLAVRRSAVLHTASFHATGADGL